MTDEILLRRIAQEPGVLAGKPVIRGTRLSVEFIVNLLAHHATPEEILAEYPGLAPDDIQSCLLFAARALQQASFVPLEPVELSYRQLKQETTLARQI